MPRSFEAVFGFAAPSGREREALRVVRAYLRRAGSALGSRDAAGEVGPDRGPAGSTGSRAMHPAMRAAVRENVEAVASFCDGLLDAAGPETPAGAGRPPGA